MAWGKEGVGLSGAVGSGWLMRYVCIGWVLCTYIADVLVFAIGIRACRGRNFIPAKAKL